MNILLVSTRNIFPIDAGFKKRIYHVGKALSEIGNVDLLITSDSIDSHNRKSTPFREIYAFSTNTMRKIPSIMLTTIWGYPIQIGYFLNKDALRWLANNKDRYDIIWFNHIRTLPYFRHLPSKQVVIDLHDSIALHYLQSIKNVNNLMWKKIYNYEYPRLRIWEEQTIKKFRNTIVVSPVDAMFIRHVYNGNVSVIPMGINDYAIREPFIKTRENIITFIGKLDYLPNLEGLLWFIDNVHIPLISHISYKLVIIGGHIPEKLKRKAKQIPHIELTGFVENPYPLMARAKINIAPIFIGAGIQNKVLEGLAVGTPTLTTSMGARPIHPALKKYLYICNNKECWTNTIKRLINNDTEIISTGRITKHLTPRFYSWEHIYKKLQNIAYNVYHEKAKHN